MFRNQEIGFVPFYNTDIMALYEVFTEAFSSYAVRMNPPFEQFSNRILHKLRPVSEFSGMITHQENRAVGFILHTIGNYGGLKTAYNGGTGIIPEYRQQKLTYQLYVALLEKIKQTDINKVMLEVVNSNQAAIALYRALDFQFRRHLKSFRLYKNITRWNEKLLIELSESLPENHETFWDYEPTFLDHTQHLKQNFTHETILLAKLEGEVIGYIIFQAAIGRISQLAVRETNRHQGVGRSLVAAAQMRSAEKKLTLMNVPEECESTIHSLKKMGFINEVDQYEMELLI